MIIVVTNQEAQNYVEEKRGTINQCWTKVHVGIGGNVPADELAMAAALTNKEIS